jgi:CheY-like chemotaxis protein
LVAFYAASISEIVINLKARWYSSGYTPLILVFDPDTNRRDTVDAALAKRQFAVAPVASIEQALDVTRGLRPEAVICRPNDFQTLRETLPLDRTPLVAVSDSFARNGQLVEVVRTALRLQRVHQ